MSTRSMAGLAAWLAWLPGCLAAWLPGCLAGLAAWLPGRLAGPDGPAGPAGRLALTVRWRNLSPTHPPAMYLRAHIVH
eukprot:2008832-Heterocapsa_arctica.AAC.1